MAAFSGSSSLSEWETKHFSMKFKAFLDLVIVSHPSPISCTCDSWPFWISYCGFSSTTIPFILWLVQLSLANYTFPFLFLNSSYRPLVITHLTSFRKSLLSPGGRGRYCLSALIISHAYPRLESSTTALRCFFFPIITLELGSSQCLVSFIQ